VEEELELTEDQVWAELSVALNLPLMDEDDSNAKSIPEMMQKRGESETTVRRYVKAALAAGTIEELRVRRPNAQGRMRPLSVYRVVK